MMDLLTANDRPGAYPPSWYAASLPPPPPRPTLHGEVEADICVVGERAGAQVTDLFVAAR